MNSQELFELAMLDAYGLLDDEEREAFESAFSAAPPALQAQIRREQTRLSRLDQWLPEVEAPLGLRAKVLAAVRRAMALRHAARERRIASLIIPGRRVSAGWRIASMGLAAAVVALAAVAFFLGDQNAKLGERLKDDVLLTQLARQLGEPFVSDVLFDRDTRHVRFTPEANFEGHAALLVNPKWSEARFFVTGADVRKGQRLVLAVIDENSNVVELLDEYTPSGGLEGFGVRINGRSSADLAIMSFEEGGWTVLSRGHLDA